jgi:hypothetical protein
MSDWTMAKLYWISKMIQAAPELESELLELESAYLIATSDRIDDINRSAGMAEQALKALRPLAYEEAKCNRAFGHAWTMFHEESWVG